MKKIVLSLSLLAAFSAHAQHFTKKDTLTGSDTRFRNFWDVKKYDFALEPNAGDKSVKGSNRISFAVTRDVVNPTFQIDLQQPMKITDIMCDFEIVDRKVDGDFVFLETKGNFRKGEEYFMEIDFAGQPKVAKNAPWDGGWIFTTDKNGKAWMSTATEGIGASVSLPLKDYWGDEPDDGMTMKLITPQELRGVSNGRKVSEEIINGKRVTEWSVVSPINAYSITPYVGDYVHFSDTFDGEGGKLSLDYYVLSYNLDKAKKQFAQVKPMLRAFEHWFGPYPFYKDGFKLVESPYLGMEHQSAVAYGNRYENGYLGRDLSGTGVGLKWDFIIIHESGHEWFANNITAKDQADMWIHESFTNYSETLFTEYNFGKEDAQKYIIGLRKNILNDRPIVGQYGVRDSGSGDKYYKGANMLHTIRQVINNDEKFREILRGLNRDFYHQTVTGKQVWTCRRYSTNICAPLKSRNWNTDRTAKPCNTAGQM